jgi:hypothetical protein
VEERRERRLAIDTPVQVSVKGLLGDPVFSGRVIDMSGSGLQISVLSPIPCGARVEVETNSTLILGEVVRCEEAAPGYAVGIALSEVRARS